jgi:hypothetical protein
VPTVMIATPTTGFMKPAYVHTLLATFADLSNAGIQAGFAYETGSDIAFLRNVLATRFLEDQQYSHLFFVDSDMQFDGSLCRILLALDKPMVGAIYQNKEQDIAKRRWHAWFPTSRIAPVNGAVPCEALPMGAALIRRDVFETMIKKCDIKRQPSHGHFLNFFSARPQDAATGLHVSEDMSFCRRWKHDCGGDIWAYIGMNIGHIGDFRYGGLFLEDKDVTIR